MRQLFIPACICLAAWSGPAGTEITTPVEASTFASIDHFKITDGRQQPTTDGSGHHPELSQVSPTMKVAALEQPKTEEKVAAVDSTARAKPDTASAAKEESPDEKLAALTPAADAAETAVETQESTADAKPKVETTGQKAKAPMPPAPKRVVHRSTREICETLAKAAQTNDVPVPFFIRLLFQESRFKPAVVSEAGAQGIAQFMPGTAASVGLDNPFDPLQAIPAAARLLHDLIDDFGNLGLAAAAYNAGPTRVHNWLSKKSHLPKETRGYVKAITGRPAETWRAAAAGHSVTRLPDSAPCQDVAGLYAWHDGKKVPLPPPAPIESRNVVVAKDDGKAETKSKDVKSAKADKADRAKTASSKAAARASKATKAARQKDKDSDAIQLAARKHRHKARSHKRTKTAAQ
ncbi:MAG TPA: lytic transglycosylase domain-containing protein [Pseudolabrys sp.]|nr:lytic transglycosylase domain-containing protein [Pseudolabrys sp.]